MIIQLWETLAALSPSARSAINGRKGQAARASNLDALIMFLVDATQPFSSPATLEVGH
jgi:hypothetical protein